MPRGEINLGATAVYNTGDQIMNLAVFCEHSTTPPGVAVEWNCSEIRVFHEQPGCSILGFEDRYEGNDHDDFDDTKVTMLTVSSDRSNLIERPKRTFIDQSNNTLRMEPP